MNVLPELIHDGQPSRTTVVWQQNRLAEARYELTPREQKLVLYVISMIEPEDESFKLYKINVKHFAALSGLDSNALYNELREVALQIKSKPLVIPGHLEPGDPNPSELITSWFADVVIQANGDGYFGVSISERLKPYLLQVKREFFKYRLAYVLHLRSGYAIRLYQWAKRWQYSGKRRITIEDLRIVMGTVELTAKGSIKKTLLALYKDFKKRALLPAVTEINEKTDIFVSFVENKLRGSKTVESLTFTITESANASRLDAVAIPRQPQLELELPERNGVAPEATVFLGKLKQDFGLSAPQIKIIQQYIETNGMAYVEEKIAVVNSEPRSNAARTFLAALKDDWKLPVKRKRVSAPKLQPMHEERPPEMSDEELAKIREESRAMFDQLRKSLRGEAKV
ncbi:MAG TPA: replication initiation protein [Terrimicrobiaceae bacterium]|nr:replication initiation protein [Terrimicrobiaceae bacterium]